MADLGHLRITNRFVVDGESGTLSCDDGQPPRGSREMAAQPGPRKAGREGRQAAAKRASGGMKNMRDMTESVFEHCYPPLARDPMTCSVYGSLEKDARYDGLEVASSILASESDTVCSPERGSSVDPSASGRCLNTQPASSELHLSPSSHSSTGSNPTTTSSGEQVEGISVHRCLLDVMDIALCDIDLLTAKRVAKRDYQRGDRASDMEFISCVVQIEVRWLGGGEHTQKQRNSAPFCFVGFSEFKCVLADCAVTELTHQAIEMYKMSKG